jgi:hypothetical protein
LNPASPLQLPLQRVTLARQNLLALGCAVLCTALPAACGGSSGNPAPKVDAAQATLDRALGAKATSIERARISADVRLDPQGLLKVGGPLVLRVKGPFAAPRGRTPARFDLAFVTTLGGDNFKGSAISTGRRSYLQLDDRVYALDAGRRRARAAPKSHPGLKSLGIDPLHWVKNVMDEGREDVGGVATTHLAGDVDSAALLADLAALLDKAGGTASFLTPKLLAQIGDAVKSAKVDIWTGADDDIVRRVAVDLRFAFKPAQSPIVGLDGGRLRLGVTLADVNGARVRVATPAGAQPLTDLTGPGGLRALLAGLGTGLTGGIAGGAIELVSCVTGAAGSSVELVRCIAHLSP